MEINKKFFICKHCGNLVDLINDGGEPLICCGEKMAELTANTSDGASEKHLPEVKINGNTVTVNVGSVSHPMTAEHYIAWAYLVTNEGIQRKHFTEGNDAVAVFALTDSEKPQAAYSYCNLHGLWKKEI